MAWLSPEGLMKRRKMEFSVTAELWLRSLLFAKLSDALDDSAWNRLDRVNLVQLRRAADAHVAGNRNYDRGLWAALILGRWLSGCKLLPIT